MNTRTFIAPVAAFAVGMLIAWLAVVLAGLVAAMPISAEHLDLILQHTGWFSLLQALAVQVPVAVLSAAACWLLFRAFGGGTATMAVACALPWLAFVLVGWAADPGQFSNAMSRNLLVAVGTLTGAICVPSGVWLAMRFSRAAPGARTE
jgi:hypothetical protein